MQINLSWTAVTGAIHYRVYRGTFTGGPYQMIGHSNPDSAGATTTYQDGPGNLDNGQDYFYRVTAVTIDGESPYGPEIAALWPGGPSAPTNVAAVIV